MKKISRNQTIQQMSLVIPFIAALNKIIPEPSLTRVIRIYEVYRGGKMVSDRCLVKSKKLVFASSLDSQVKEVLELLLEAIWE